MQPRLKIDLVGGTIEVEGDEKLVRAVYADFKEQVKAYQKPASDQRRRRAATRPVTKGTGQKTRRTKATRRGGKASIVKDLDLSGKGKGKSLREFFTEKKPSRFNQQNTVFVYYLERIAKVDRIGLGHVYTCYKEVGKRLPTRLDQSLTDTSHHNGWLDTKALDDIKLTTIGENYVEHDLPKAPGKKD